MLYGLLLRALASFFKSIPFCLSLHSSFYHNVLLEIVHSVISILAAEQAAKKWFEPFLFLVLGGTSSPGAACCVYAIAYILFLFRLRVMIALSVICPDRQAGFAASFSE